MLHGFHCTTVGGLLHHLGCYCHMGLITADNGLIPSEYDIFTTSLRRTLWMGLSHAITESSSALYLQFQQSNKRLGVTYMLLLSKLHVYISARGPSWTTQRLLDFMEANHFTIKLLSYLMFDFCSCRVIKPVIQVLSVFMWLICVLNLKWHNRKTF